MLIELLVRYKVLLTPTILSDVLAVPFNSLKGRYGADHAFVILIRLAELTDNPSILADIEENAAPGGWRSRAGWSPAV